MRYGFGLHTTLLLTVCVPSAVFFVQSRENLPLAQLLLGLPLCGAGVAMALVIACSREVALRVDASGILLGRPVLRRRGSAVLVPWEDVQEICLWRQWALDSTTRWVGVTGRPDAPAFPGRDAKAAGKRDRTVPAWVPAEAARTGVPVYGWRLDRGRLDAALAHHAPHVPVRRG